VYGHAPPNDPSKSVLSLPTEVIVQLNFKTAVALMCTNRVLHAAGITALCTRVYLRGQKFKVLNPGAPNLVVPGMPGGLLAKRGHTAALRYFNILSMPCDANYWTAFSTLVYRIFEQTQWLVPSTSRLYISSSTPIPREIISCNICISSESSYPPPPLPNRSLCASPSHNPVTERGPIQQLTLEVGYLPRA